MEEKEDKKKGFLASLFAPKPCKCSCGVQIEEVEEDGNPSENLKKDETKVSEKNDTSENQGNSCGCCG